MERPTPRRTRATELALACALGAAVLVYGHTANQAVAFFAGLVALVSGLAALAHAAARSHWIALPQLLLATASVLLAFAIVELASALWIAAKSQTPEDVLEMHGFDEARADRTGFLRRWERHLRRWADLDRRIVMTDPTGRNPFVLRPGARIRKGDAEIFVNQLGFRGRETPRDKGDRFRIVALGESTTFGLTVRATDRTWPEVLESRIARELDCEVPVEVINAGVPGWTIANQIIRLESDVFPLEPDLILAHHGHNGFHWLLRGVPGLALARPGHPRPRPSRLLTTLERLLWRRRLLALQPDLRRGVPSVRDADLARIPYARSYIELARSAQQRGVQVALSTFNLAVDADSPEDAIRFYEEFTPDLRSVILANRLHDRIVRRAAAITGALAIDTSARLDGAYRDAYVDLVHFNQVGRDRLASNVLEGIRLLLRSRPRPGCRERSIP